MLPDRNLRPTGPDMLVVAISGRALAASARRAGYRVAVIDLFDDVDTRALAVKSVRAAGSLRSGFRSGALVTAAGRLAPAPLPIVYGSGFDRRTRLLARMAKGRVLLGNPPAIVRRLKHPASFFPMLDRLDIPYPATTLERPAQPRGWLAKRIGGAGGAHIRPARSAPDDGSMYFQRNLRGRPVSALFLADGASAVVLGLSEQWSDPGPGERTFRFGGVVFPAVVSARVHAMIVASIERLVRECRLVGANSADLLIDDRGFSLLEVNPRPGATVDAFDHAYSDSLFGLHVDACAGKLPSAWHRPVRASAGAIVYADRRLVAPTVDFWSDWAADIPEPRSVIRAGDPICTVRADAGEPTAARELAIDRARRILTGLRPRGTRQVNIPAPAEFERLT